MAARRRSARARFRAMHSRIAGTGSYLPAHVAHQRRAGAARRHQRRVDPHAHRHPPAPHRRGRTSRRAISRCAASRQALAAAGIAPADVDLIIVATTTPDMIFPSTACILQAKLGVQGGAGVRRAGGVQRLRLRARRSPTCMVQSGQAQQCAGRRRRRSIRASSTGTTAAPACCSATAPARSCSRRRRSRASCRRICTPTAAIATSSAVPGTVRERRGQRHAVR